MAEKVVNTYRREYTKICLFWTDLERAFKFVLSKGIPAAVGKLKLYSMPECPVVIELPNSRLLHYHDARLRGGQIRLGNLPTWGGSLVENVTQAVARDVLMEAALKVADNGIKVVHRVHDEIICHVAEADIAVVKKAARRIVCTPPVWAKDLPLNGKATVAVRYSA
jgi:DNA polymerase